VKPDKELIKTIISVKDTIDLKYWDKSISIKNLSLEFGIDRKILGIMFKEQFGVTIHEYLNKRRIEKARELLKKNQHSISDVASLTGFSSRTNFYRVFKRMEGISPRECIINWENLCRILSK
jgi:two-component system response regulator YesN